MKINKNKLNYFINNQKDIYFKKYISFKIIMLNVKCVGG